MHRGLPQSEFCSLAAALFAYRKHSFAEQKIFIKFLFCVQPSAKNYVYIGERRSRDHEKGINSHGRQRAATAPEQNAADSAAV